MKQILIIGLLMLAGCATPTPRPTRDPKAVQTSVAATLAAIPTASELTPRAPTPQPPVAPTDTEPPPATATPVAAAGEYVVQLGDTLSIIAIRYGTSMAALQSLNDLDDPRLVRAGQRLKIPADKLAPDENPFWILIVAQPGETLSSIALKYGVRLEDLLRVNRIADASVLRAGQRLIIPVPAPA
jgi:LysM repeat protein